MLVSSIVTSLAFFVKSNKAESFEGSTATYVAYWYEAWNPDRFIFDSRLTNGNQVRDGQDTDKFWDGRNQITDAGYIKIPAYITNVDQVEFELVSKPAHVLDPQTRINEDGTMGLQIIEDYMGTGERRLRIPVVSVPATAKISGVINPYGSTGRAYRYDTKITYRLNFKPEEIVEEPVNESGQVAGKVFWELRRFDPMKSPETYVESSFKIVADHYATRNIGHAVSFAGLQKRNNGGKISIKQSETGMDNVKGLNIDYVYHYEFTESPIGWVCSGSGDDEVCWWDASPDWSQVQQFVMHDTLPIKHKLGESADGKLDDVLLEQSPVGKSDTWNYPVKETKDFYETYRRAPGNTDKDHYQLKTQTAIPIAPGPIELLIELPSGEHKKPSYNPFYQGLSTGYSYPPDVDDSLKEDYKNRNTKNDVGYPYAFPLQQNIAKDKGMEGEMRVFETGFTTDMFFPTKHTGYNEGIPYTEMIKDHLTNGAALPTSEELIKQGKAKVKKGYEETTGQEYVDVLIIEEE